MKKYIVSIILLSTVFVNILHAAYGVRNIDEVCDCGLFKAPGDRRSCLVICAEQDQKGPRRPESMW